MHRVLIPLCLFVFAIVNIVLCKHQNDHHKNHEHKKRIYYGSEVEEGNADWMVNLMESVNKTHFCGGVFYDNYTVITAAHCLANDRFPVNSLQVETGSLEISKGQRIPVKKYFVHPNYDNKTHVSDIAVVCLRPDGPIKGSSPVTVWENETQDYSFAEVYGWGKDQTNKWPRVLNSVTSRVVSNEGCEKRFDQVGMGSFVTDKSLCALGLEHDPSFCLGDTGGPVCYRRHAIDDRRPVCELIGISIWGQRCNPERLKRSTDFPDVFTRVSKFAKWIKAKSEECPPLFKDVKDDSENEKVNKNKVGMGIHHGVTKVSKSFALHKVFRPFLQHPFGKRNASDSTETE